MRGMRGGRRERWLHTRISEHLEDALKREARRRRSPVSLVVRNVLESALDLVEDIVEDSLEVARRSRDFAHTGRGARRGGERSDSLQGIYGWEELILNRGATCGRCRSEVPTGELAYRGLRDQPGPPAFLCMSCIGRLRQEAADKKERAS